MPRSYLEGGAASRYERFVVRRDGYKQQAKLAYRPECQQFPCDEQSYVDFLGRCFLKEQLSKCAGPDAPGMYLRTPWAS